MQLSNVFARYARTCVYAGMLLLGGTGLLGCADLDPCRMGTADCACREASDPGGPCDNGMICAAGTCFARVGFDAPEVCYDACTYRKNGQCDDGGDDPTTAHCSFGSDCTDCGPRANPCPANSPVYCPQRIVGASQCYPAGTDCRTLRTCDGAANPGPFHCPTGATVDCAQGGTCVASTGVCTTAAPVECLSPIPACVEEFTDCNTLERCPDVPTSPAYACFYSESLLCSSGIPSCQGF